MTDLRSRIGNMVSLLNQSWLKTRSQENIFSQQLHPHRVAEGGHTDDLTTQERLCRSGKTSLPLLDRIQMDQEETHGEKSLIERIEIAPDDMNGRINQSTPLWANSVESRNGKLIDSNIVSGSEDGANQSKKRYAGRLNASNSPKTGPYKQPISGESSKHPANDARSRSSANSSDPRASRDYDVSSLNRGSASFSHMPRPSPSVSPEAFVDHFLPLAQRIADVRIGDPQDRALPNGPHGPAEVNSSVITEEIIARFSQQLMKLGKDLHHHHEVNGTQSFPIEKTQDVAAGLSNGSESQILSGTFLNGSHGHNPEPTEGTIAHEPSGSGKKTPGTPKRARNSSPEHHDQRRHLLPLSSSSHKDHDPSRRYPSSGHHNSSGDSPHQRRGRRRESWDFHDYRHDSPKSRREDSDHMSASPHKRKIPDLPSKKDGLDSSPTRYRRGSSGQRRSHSHSHERRHHSSERSKYDSMYRQRTDSMSNHVKEPYTNASWSGSVLLEELLEKHKRVALSQQATRKLSGLNVPGLWFLSRGLRDIGMSTFQFEIDEKTALLMWNLQNDHITTTETPHLSLELSCFSVDDVQMTLQNLGRDIRLHDVLKAFSALKNTWPPQGHLIFCINPERQSREYWFPDTFLQQGPINLEEFIYEGSNIVRLIQLSDLSRSIFVLLSTGNGIENGSTRSDFLLPEKGSGMSFEKAVPTISKA